ncbi:bacillithiol system redox-active protein YtxJ [Flavobacteriaceae bacterium TP-CH-4]|uniref:Bacillithiol system redox-active protein YtxJ n=1 Tax=Pelagihabitans pacificus TaxID=2696054 RepID=A0A967EAB8_9FLAO|nr:bacillithiol system redox-active protein YtxJ [Pelagihabitans pacificus]NHF59281.1 bacillithiol system redox-active protein YtxJ [Pelagihabitans pacificus]
MGVFDSLFGGKGEKEKTAKKVVPWIPLTSLDQLSEIGQKSSSKTQLIFKHSNTCGISRMVMNLFGGNYRFTNDQIDLYYLDIHAYREVSNEIGHHFQVVHQSPQLLVIRNGTVVAHASHGAITEVDLERYL